MRIYMLGGSRHPFKQQRPIYVHISEYNRILSKKMLHAAQAGEKTDNSNG